MPVVATNVSGIPEIIINNQTGLLVSQRDPLDLALSINTLLNDAMFSQKLGQQGRIFAQKHFDTNTNTTRLIDIFKQNISIND